MFGGDNQPKYTEGFMHLLPETSRLKITLTQEFRKEIIVSREKVGFFKIWLDGHYKLRI